MLSGDDGGIERSRRLGHQRRVPRSRPGSTSRLFVTVEEDLHQFRPLTSCQDEEDPRPGALNIGACALALIFFINLQPHDLGRHQMREKLLSKGSRV